MSSPRGRIRWSTAVIDWSHCCHNDRCRIIRNSPCGLSKISESALNPERITADEKGAFDYTKVSGRDERQYRDPPGLFGTGDAPFERNPSCSFWLRQRAIESAGLYDELQRMRSKISPGVPRRPASWSKICTRTK